MKSEYEKIVNTKYWIGKDKTPDMAIEIIEIFGNRVHFKYIFNNGGSIFAERHLPVEVFVKCYIPNEAMNILYGNKT